mgnify:CR=1 FL=1
MPSISFTLSNQLLLERLEDKELENFGLEFDGNATINIFRIIGKSENVNNFKINDIIMISSHIPNIVKNTGNGTINVIPYNCFIQGGKEYFIIDAEIVICKYMSSQYTDKVTVK